MQTPNYKWGMTQVWGNLSEAFCWIGMLLSRYRQWQNSFELIEESSTLVVLTLDFLVPEFPLLLINYSVFRCLLNSVLCSVRQIWHNYAMRAYTNVHVQRFDNHIDKGKNFFTWPVVGLVSKTPQEFFLVKGKLTTPKSFQMKSIFWQNYRQS